MSLRLLSLVLPAVLLLNSHNLISKWPLSSVERLEWRRQAGPRIFLQLSAFSPAVPSIFSFCFPRGLLAFFAVCSLFAGFQLNFIGLVVPLMRLWAVSQLNPVACFLLNFIGLFLMECLWAASRLNFRSLSCLAFLAVLVSLAVL